MIVSPSISNSVPLLTVFRLSRTAFQKLPTLVQGPDAGNLPRKRSLDASTSARSNNSSTRSKSPNARASCALSTTGERWPPAADRHQPLSPYYPARAGPRQPCAIASCARMSQSPSAPASPPWNRSPLRRKLRPSEKICDPRPFLDRPAWGRKRDRWTSSARPSAGLKSHFAAARTRPPWTRHGPAWSPSVARSGQRAMALLPYQHRAAPSPIAAIKHSSIKITAICDRSRLIAPGRVALYGAARRSAQGARDPRPPPRHATRSASAVRSAAKAERRRRHRGQLVAERRSRA